MEALVFLIFLVAFSVFMLNIVRASRNEVEARSAPPRPLRRPTLRSPEPRAVGAKQKRPGAAATTLARQAMRRAGYQAGPDYVQVSDLGLLAYRSVDEPRLLRDSDVMEDTQYLRPFAELWVPFRARGTVRFEIVDGQGRVRYANEEPHDLKAGKNSLLPNTWLPLHNQTVDEDDWQLRIQSGGVVLAVHTFGWEEFGEHPLSPYMANDGEISHELRAMMMADAGQSLSLSDLLSEQED